ncbi:MAG: hypothetical protein RLZZ292_923, partial [Bacteroidota bacterium]
NGQTTLLANPTNTTTYTVTATLGTCTATDDVIVTVHTAPNITASADVSICPNGLGTTLTASSNNSSTYVWSNGQTTLLANPTNTTTYTVTATLGTCSATDDVIVTVHTAPNINAGADLTICPGGSVLLTASTNNGSSYGWSSGATSITVSPAMTTTYLVTATLGSCTATDNVVVNINAPTLVGGVGGTNLTVQCEDGNWSYYGNSAGIYFGIEWGSNVDAKTNAQVDILINATSYDAATTTEATYIMKRTWDVHHQTPGQTLSLTSPVKVRFFYDQAEKDAINNKATTFATLYGGAIKPFSWFKTNDGSSAFSVSLLSSTGLTGCYILNSFTESTMNGVNYVEFNGVTGFSGGTGGTGVGSASILPVTLSEFKGTRSGERVKLQWKTASEINTKSFVVEKSIDGIHFKPLMEVPAAGSSKEIRSYSQWDSAPMQGMNYYRLLSIDTDKSSRYVGHIVSVNFIDATNTMRIYPNPVNNNLTLHTYQNEASVTQIRILNLTGQLMQVIDVNLEQGQNTQTLDVHTLHSGTYILQLVKAQQEETEMLRFVKVAQ